MDHLLPSFTSKPPQNLDYDKENEGRHDISVDSHSDGEASPSTNHAYESWQGHSPLQQREYSFHNDFPSFDQLRSSLEVTYRRPGASSKHPGAKEHHCKFQTSAPTAFSKHQTPKTAKPLMEIYHQPAALSSITANNAVLSKRRTLFSRLCRHPQAHAMEEAQKQRGDERSSEEKGSWTSFAFCSRAAVEVNNFQQKPDDLHDQIESSCEKDHIFSKAKSNDFDDNVTADANNTLCSTPTVPESSEKSSPKSQHIATFVGGGIGEDHSSDESDGSAVEALLDGTLQMHLNDSYITETVPMNEDVSSVTLQITSSGSSDSSESNSCTVCVLLKETNRERRRSPSKDCGYNIFPVDSSDLSALSLTAHSLSSSSSKSTATRLADKEVLLLNFRKGGGALKDSKEICFQASDAAAPSSVRFLGRQSSSPRQFQQHLFLDQEGRSGAVLSFTPWYMSGVPDTDDYVDQNSAQSLKERCLTEETSSSLSTPSRSPPRTLMDCEMAKENVFGLAHPKPLRPDPSSQINFTPHDISPPRVTTSPINFHPPPTIQRNDESNYAQSSPSLGILQNDVNKQGTTSLSVKSPKREQEEKFSVSATQFTANQKTS